ncbi:hypothetical protein EP47_08315 [Legionella norrlandica]|uniref:Uncharacterized protein n=1 Tax=Legionella norrlandica TaxID=1498499 RepID=A0A0A2SSN7_9GAMM|nr:hypothetical protein [Legionella norrlandica]KGP62409.1 hypothetical protein EP47_08315 [Legionella norrlandica]
MAKNIKIDFSKLDEQNKIHMREYQEKLIKELGDIVDVIKRYNPDSKISKDKVTDPGTWTMQHVVPSTGRSSPNIALKVPGKANEVSTGIRQSLKIEGNENLFSYLKHQLDEAIDKAPKEEKEKLKGLKEYVDLLNLQVISKIAEMGAIDNLDKFKRHFHEIYKNDNSSRQDLQAQRICQEIDLCITQLGKCLEKYSLDFLSNGGTLDNHTTADAGRLRKEVKSLYKEIVASVKELDKSGYLIRGENGKYIPKILNELKAVEGCFQHKNNLSFDLPTAGQTKSQMARKLTTLGLGITSLTCGVLATGCAVASFINPTGPVATGPAALALGGTAVVTGAAASGTTIINGAYNYLMYRVPFSTDEKITIGLTGASFLVAGAGVASNLTSALPVLVATVQQTNDTAKTVISAGMIGKGVSEGLSKKNLQKEIDRHTEDPQSNPSPSRNTP